MTTSDVNTNADPTAAGEISITRIFDAPREVVFKAWTEPERFVRWWGPKGFTTPFCTIDRRVGGAMHYCMRSPEGQAFWCKGVFREIVEPERLVYTDFFVDEEGVPVGADYYGLSPDWPPEMLVTVTFAEQDGKTKLTLRQAIGSPPAPERDGAEQGWTESFDRLADHVAGI